MVNTEYREMPLTGKTTMTWQNAALLRKWDCLSSIPIATNENGQQSWPHFSPIGRQDYP
jgi:hypothetical protein